MFIIVYTNIHITFLNINTSEESHPITSANMWIEASKVRTSYVSSNTMIAIDKPITLGWMFINFCGFLFLTEIFWNTIFTKWFSLISITVYICRVRLLY